MPLINKIERTDLDYLRKLFNELEIQQNIVFIADDSKYRSLEYKHIELFKINTSHYDITITKEDETFETLKNQIVSFNRNKDKVIVITLYSPVETRSLSIYRSELYGTLMALSI